MRTIVAIPSSHPGGLDAMLGAHFGHCDLYTLVTLEDKAITSVDVIPNVPHQQGGCMAPVMMLKQAGADALIAELTSGDPEIEAQREHVSDILDYFVPKEEIIKQGLMDKFERNYLDKQDALDKTAVALTQKGIDVICAKNLH